MNIENQLKNYTAEAVKELYDIDFDASNIIINETRKEFEGDLTVVIFPFVKIAKKKPEEIGDTIGKLLAEKIDFINSTNTVKGFLNIAFTDKYWLDKLASIGENKDYGKLAKNGKTVVLEYCGPNTNKPIHLGHIRNMVIGYSMAEILQATGYDVHKVNILNDRGIAICRSMLAWQKFANGETPESTGIKGDHFVGKYYVKFNTELNAEYEQWQTTDAAKEKLNTFLQTEDANKLKEQGADEEKLTSTFFKKYKNDYVNNESNLGAEARKMLLDWEAGEASVRELWEKMNNWVFEGFNETFDRLEIDFEEHYKESDYYNAGKEMVQQGLNDGVFYKKEDGSIWADLEDKKLDHKILLRSDGTSVYVTQDMGVAQARYDKYKMDISIYTVADEQNYHFKVLQGVLEKMGKSYADGIHHLSYGMVDLTTGKMKSREGTIVDADDLIAEVVAKAKQTTLELGKINDFSDDQADELFEKIGIGAIRYYILSVNPKKRMTFDPEKSVELEGATAPFIQYSYARIQSVLKKYGKEVNSSTFDVATLEPLERELIISLNNFESVIKSAGTNYDPSEISSYTYNLAKLFNKFYAHHPILTGEQASIDFRIYLSNLTGAIIKKGLKLLGIKTTERM